MSVYKPKSSPFYHFDFQVRGTRFCGSTGCRDRRQAEAVERAERERAKSLSRRDRDLPRSYGEAAARFWNEVGQHNATADDTRRNLVWLGDAIGEDTLLRDIDGDLVSKIIAKRRGERSKNGGKLVTNATVNRTVTEPLKRLLGRAKAWGVRLDHEPDWRKHLLPEPQERVRELAEEEGDRLDAPCAMSMSPSLPSPARPAFGFASASWVGIKSMGRETDNQSG